MEISINYMAIAIATFANLALGWTWYGPLFGKAWAKELNIEIPTVPNKAAMYKGMALMVIGNFLMAFVMSHDIFVWRKFPGMENMSGLSTAWMSAFFTWIGYYVPTHIGATAWEQKSWKLTILNLTYHLATLFITAMLIVKLA